MLNKIHIGNAIDLGKKLEPKSINTIITSPPYYGLRDYGMDGQIGIEPTPEDYITRLVSVFRTLRDGLSDNGTLWINIGDSYARNGGSLGGGNRALMHMEGKQKRMMKIPAHIGIKEKDLIGIPWMLAFALRADGWWLRQDIIWNKPNPMPEAVTDRCTKSHEYIFLLSKSKRYYYDHNAIKTRSINPDADERRFASAGEHHKYVPSQKMPGIRRSKRQRRYELANKRSVWTIAPAQNSFAHFATFPESLIVDMVKAGCPIGGTVLDPFMGTGTTALVARKLDRNFIGFELNHEYAIMAENRLKNELSGFQRSLI